MVTHHSREGRLKVAIVLLSFVLVGAFALAQGTSPARAARSWNVSMYGDDMSQDYEFMPAVLNITVGDTVTWTSVVGTHTTTSLPNQTEWWDSGSVAQGNSFVHTFTTVGTFNYTSLVDPQMFGTVVAQQPTPEFPGLLAISTVALAVLLGVFVERKLGD